MILKLAADEPAPWHHGLEAVRDHGCTVLVEVEGSDLAIGGELSHVDDGAIVVVRSDPGRPDGGDAAVWIPRNRVVTVTIPFTYGENEP
jgi:hypothetical protein